MLFAHQVLQYGAYKVEPKHVAKQMPGVEVKEHVGEGAQEFESLAQF